jgi:raffinose/stachyose/melibiose transport system substrate-binding protein
VDMLRRGRVRWLGAVLATALLAACSGSAASSPSAGSAGTPSPASSAASAGASSAATSGPAVAKLTMWVNSADAQPLKDLWARYTKDTGVQLDVVSFPSDGFETALRQRWATGDRPDILEWHANFDSLVSINPKDNLRDLSSQDFVKRQKTGISAGVDGVTYGVVLNTPTSWGIFYNKPIFTKLGLTPPTTAAEVLATCQAIKKADPSIVPMEENAGSLWPPLVINGQFQADGLQSGFLQKLIDRKAKVNDPDSPWLRSLQWYKQLQDAGCFNKDVLTAKFENSANLILSGKTAMVSLHSGFVGALVDASNVDTVNKTIGWTAWSETRPVVTVEYSPNGTYYLPKTGDAAREAASLGFLQFITGPAYVDYVKAASIIPTFQDVATPETVAAPLVAINDAIAKDGSTVPVWSVLPGITDLVNYPGKLLNGELTPQSAVDLLQKEAEAGAKAAGLPAWPNP